ncbi:hypothetical protein K2173_000500 [Erythroxylum novogranatense]|uniref:Uncharacterized protein n=1 Tax=Erythroxylum novogranatense TaxID=1862640 RepID=A0AAV8SXD8_9ROSI|nr:hypothetical protein K2173_000500 [Erythroxylum novogranatense]
MQGWSKDQAQVNRSVYFGPWFRPGYEIHIRIVLYSPQHSTIHPQTKTKFALDLREHNASNIHTPNFFFFFFSSTERLTPTPLTTRSRPNQEVTKVW